MVSKVSSRRARKSAPVHGQRPVSSRGASAQPFEKCLAVLARPLLAAGGKTASSAALVLLDAEFLVAFRRAYGRSYRRTFHDDRMRLALLLRDCGGSRALASTLIARAFAEPLLVECGIDSPRLVVAWASTLAQPARGGTRLSRAQQRLCRAVIAERAGGRA